MIERILACEGSYYEIGRKQGELLSYSIRSNLSIFWNRVRARGFEKKGFLKNALRSEGLFSPQMLEQIEGIGDGIRAEFPEVLAYNQYHDVIFPEECTVLMAVGKASATGNTLFLKNSDKVGSDTYAGPHSYRNKEINIIAMFSTKEGPKVIGVAAAGTIGFKMGLNDRGVATGSNISRTKELAMRGAEKDAMQIKALDRGALMREGLEKGRNAMEAAQAIMPNLMKNPMSTPGNLEFADAKEAVIIEGSYQELAMERVKDNVAARSNCFILLKELNREDDLSSLCRYIRGRQLLSECKGNVTVERMIHFSMDHANGPGPNSICRHGSHFSEETSLAAAVMEINAEMPAKSRITIALGKPCHAWRAEEARIQLTMDMLEKDIPEGLRSGEIWKKYYTEEAKE